MKPLSIIAAIFALFGLARAETIHDPKEQCEKLMNAILPFAEQMLRAKGEFFPYGGALRINGEITSVAASDGHESPPSIDVINMLKSSFIIGAKSGEYVATALVYDVRITLPATGQKSDAIAISLNHQSHYSSVVYIPYELKAGILYYGEIFSQKGEFDIFINY
jgi:hypothetical protein